MPDLSPDEATDAPASYDVAFPTSPGAPATTTESPTPRRRGARRRPPVILGEARSRAGRKVSRTEIRAREILRRLSITWRPGALRHLRPVTRDGRRAFGIRVHPNGSVALGTRVAGDAGLAVATSGPAVTGPNNDMSLNNGAVFAVDARHPTRSPLSAAAPTGYDLALVLSGGGARGFAHVGVLEVVEELQLPVDLVVGVSMGSIVGAGYAAGLSATEMADLARAMRLTSIFRPRPGRLNLVDPAGIREVISHIFGTLRFEDLERELVIVSSSLTSGEHFVIRDGPVVDAIVASCSIPLVFPPVSLDGHQLLDGGLIDGLPITIARGLGARRIVAVDASTHARHVLRLPGVRHATRGVVRILDRRLRSDLDAVRIFSRVLHHATQPPNRPPVELLIRPAFGRRSTLHYHRWSDMVARGRAAAEAARPALAALAAPPPNPVRISVATVADPATVMTDAMAAARPEIQRRAIPPLPDA